MKKILIAGGTGFIGSFLRRFLLGHQYKVYILTTQKALNTNPHYIYWNPVKQIIGLHEVIHFDTVINLAGANIGDSFWTKKRKQELIESRLFSTRCLKELINNKQISADYLIQSSAIGYYGSQQSNWLTETSPNGDGFLATLCLQWENELDGLNIPHTILRLGVVFHPIYGAFTKLVRSLDFKMSLLFGKGNQYISWIEILDLVRMIEFIIDSKPTGIINAVSPKPIKMNRLLKKFIAIQKNITIPLYIPKFLVKLVLGSFSELLLDSQRVSSQRIETMGFVFKVPTFDAFLSQIHPHIISNNEHEADI